MQHMVIEGGKKESQAPFTTPLKNDHVKAPSMLLSCSRT